MDFKLILAGLFITAFIIVVAIAIFKPSLLWKSKTTSTSTSTPGTRRPRESSTTTSAPRTSTSTQTSQRTTTTQTPVYPSTPVVATIAATTTLSPKVATTLAPAYTANMTIWLDATVSSNWLGDTWVNNAPIATRTSNASFIKGVWTSSSWVENAIQGLPAISFNGYNALGTTDAKGTYNAGITLFVVFQPTGKDTSRTLVARTVATSPVYAAPFDMNGTQRLVGNGTANKSFRCAVDINEFAIGTPYIFAYRISNASGTASVSEWLNGNLQYLNLKLTLYSDAVVSSLQIGTRGYKDTSFTGYMGEIMVYKTVLTDSQVNSVNAYLSQKWGISITPPTYASFISAQSVSIARVDNVNDYINFGEIQVFDKMGNLIQPTADQPNTGMDATYTIKNAFDGDPNTYTYTAAGVYVMQMQLDTDYDIGKVVVVNRQDGSQTRMQGCALRLMKDLSYAVYVSAPVSKVQYMYEFTFDVQNTLSISYYSSTGKESVAVYVNSYTNLVTETVKTTIMSQTYKIGYTPSTITISYTNTDGGDVYLTKLEYNGKDLRSTYRNTDTTLQTAVMAGTLARTKVNNVNTKGSFVFSI